MLLEICLTLLVIVVLCILYVAISTCYGEKIDKWMDERIPQWITPGKMVMFVAIVSVTFILGRILFF